MTYKKIATNTFSNVAAVTITGINSGYTDLVIQGSLYGASGNGTASIRFGNTTIDSGSNYSESEFYNAGSSSGYQRLASTGITIGRATGVGASASDPQFFRIQVMSYRNTSFYKTVLMESGRSGGGTIRLTGAWRSTSAIDILSISMSVNLYGVVDVYGIK